MLIKRAYKYRIYPNKEQQGRLANQFGATRFIYNYFLRQRIDYYAQTGKTLTYHDTALRLTELKKHSQYAWLNSAYSQVLQQSLKDLDTAYNNFFNKRTKFPVFKKKHSKQSARFPQHFKLNSKRLHIPKIGWIKIALHRPIEGKIKNLTVSRTKSGKYFASIQVEQEIAQPAYEGEQIGLDLGLRDFAITSEGQRFLNPKYLKKSEKKLAKLQRQLSRTKKGSQGREKARIKVARQHEKIVNQRNDFLHKLSHKLIGRNQLIAIEDLNIKGMLTNHRVAKAIGDASWFEFIRQLEYKGQWYGCQVERIDRFFPSSKRCYHCGFINKTLQLIERKWDCLKCGSVLDRDINAAQNILWYTVGATEINATRQTVSPISVGNLDEGGNLIF